MDMFSKTLVDSTEKILLGSSGALLLLPLTLLTGHNG